jgi:hypothetical protein
MQKWIWILWPSFLIAAAASWVYFTLFDPVDLDIFGVHVSADRAAAYTIGFFAFWFLGAASSALTLFFQHSADEVNRLGPPEPTEPPSGAPKQEGA